MIRSIAALSCVVLLLAVCGVQAQEAGTTQQVTKDVTIHGKPTKLQLNIVQSGAQANAPPSPQNAPVTPMQTAPAAALGSVSVPQALPVVTPAATLGAPAVPAQTAPVDPNESLGTYAVESVPGTRIVGEDDDKCGCEKDPCANPCAAKSPTVEDVIEGKLEDVKNEIVSRSQELAKENMWVRQVQDIIKHYHDKIRAVSTNTSGLKNDIKALFAKKKHYEDLLLQHRLDQDHFEKVVKEEQSEEQAAAEESSGAATVTPDAASENTVRASMADSSSS